MEEQVMVVTTAKEKVQKSLVAVVVGAVRKCLLSCRDDEQRHNKSHTVLLEMDIGWPNDVQHITHVTFDKFNGFLGLPVELQVHVPSLVPCASTSVFGVSAESMRCRYDSKGNSIPAILLSLQKRLYARGGLKAEGIFRINPENNQEEHRRKQLNRGRVPDDLDVHHLAGFIKAWFRELPSGVLDGLSPVEVQHCRREKDYLKLMRHLKPTESALLNWAVDLMADVVQEEESNKMNARNIAVVFAPNMTTMLDPMTALSHAKHVMNFLKILIIRRLRERKATDGEQNNDDNHRQREMDISSKQEPAPLDNDDTGRDFCSTDTGYCDDYDETESSSELEEELLRKLQQEKRKSSTSFHVHKMDPVISLTSTEKRQSSSLARDENDFRLGAGRQKNKYRTAGSRRTR